MNRKKQKVAGMIDYEVKNMEVLIGSATSVQQEYCQDGHVISQLALLIQMKESSIEIKLIAVLFQVGGLTRGVACMMCERECKSISSPSIVIIILFCNNNNQYYLILLLFQTGQMILIKN